MNTKERIIQYLDLKGITKTTFFAITGIKRGFLDADKLSGAVTDEHFAKILATYADINPMWLLTGEGDVLNSEPTTEPNQNIISRDFISVPIVDISAAAGGGTENSDYYEINESINLPKHMLKKGKHLCINVDGRSMEPTISNGSQLIIRLFDRCDWRDVKSGEVYVITDREGYTYVKRVENNISDRGIIKLISDNDNKQRYRTIELQEDEIYNVWSIEYYLTSQLPTVEQDLQLRVTSIENDVRDIKTMLKSSIKTF